MTAVMILLYANGVATGLVAYPVLRTYGHHLGRFIPDRIIPPPAVGRWQVWQYSGYPTVGPRRIGRYRVRWTAALVCWAINRRASTHNQCEIRRVTKTAA